MQVLKSLKLYALSFLILTFPLSPSLIADDYHASNPTVGIDDPNISIFIGAMKTAGLGDIFVGTGPFTVFAPTNDAFEKVDKKKWEEMLQPEHRDQLTTFILHHIVHGKYLSKNLKRKMTIKPLDGPNLQVTFTNGEIFIKNSKVGKMDMVGPNGVVHEIDSLIETPPTN